MDISRIDEGENRTVLKKVWKISSAIIICLIAVVTVSLVGLKLAGLRPYTVLSGSMTPAYPVGALIYVKPAQPQEIQVGDPITFYMGDGSTVATHRVIEIDPGNQYFYTKGDANDTPDGSPVNFDHLIGTPIISIPALGYISVFIATPPGLYIGAGLVLAIVLLTFLPGLMKKAFPEEEKASQNKAEERARIRNERKAAHRAANQ